MKTARETMKKIYIAGPMTGKPEMNFPAFFEAEKQLIARGFIPVNPARAPKGLEPADYMKIDLVKLSICDAIVMLDGWKDSIGARAENAAAISLRMPVFEMKDILNQFPVKETIFGKKIDSIVRAGRTITIKMKKEMAERGLLRMRDDNNLDCTSCIATSDQACQKWRQELTKCSDVTCGIDMKYYANKAQTEALIAEWDQRYIDEGGLFVCGSAGKCGCHTTCIRSKPHVYFSGRTICVCLVEPYIPVPYRGERPEPAAELKKDRSDTEYNDKKQELKKAGDDILKTGSPTNDPIVSLGDKFENHEGVWMAVNSFPEYMHLVLIEKTNKKAVSPCEGCSEGKSVSFGNPCKLSDLVGHDLLKDFRRVD